MVYRKMLIVMLACLAYLPILAQKRSTISGYVRDADGIVTDASVLLEGVETGALTNSKGFFEFTDIKPGIYTISVSYIGYDIESRKVVINTGQRLALDFMLKKNLDELHEVNVIGKTKARELRESGFSVNAIETKQFANSTTDINQVLNLTTGIRIREEGGLGSNFNFSINGLSGKAVKYFIDGVPIGIFGSAMSLNNMPVNLAERIEVYKGVVPVELGSDAMGGAVNVITSQKQTSYLDISHSYGSFNTHRSAFTGQYVHKKTGLLLKASAFYNYSDNNYKMKGVEILEGGTREGKEITNLEGASFAKTDTRRFHDAYQSVMGQVELGIINKKWADFLFVSGGFTEGNQDLQTGFEQAVVYGNVARKSNALNSSIRYKKNNLFIQGLNLNLFSSVSKDHYTTTDTLLRQYYWDGTWTDKGATEMGSIKTLSHIIRPRSFARANLSYTINAQHSLNINYTIDRLKNENYNELIVPGDDMPGVMNKQILGFAYQQEFFERRWTNIFFAKQYGLDLTRTKWMDNAYKSTDTAFNNFGYGVASRYKILPDLGIKASFERAYRLQEVEEMFGDGLSVQPNPDLKPESSYNLNLGAYYGLHIQKHRFFIEASAFYRNAADFIYTVPDQRSKNLTNENKSSVRVTGLEGELRYDYSSWFSFNINATYQNAINTTKFGGTSSINYEATYLNKIPNQPWIFGNASLSLQTNNVPGKDARLQFNWYTQYVHWFYLTWEAFGGANGKSDIPDQFVHNASLTYSLVGGMYNISVESRNLTDNLSYDNFKLQKPGRSFSVKFRYFLK